MWRTGLVDTLGPGVGRVRAGWLPILQCSVGAGLAWFVAYDLLEHPEPFFAPIAAVLALGVSLGQRLSRTLQLLGGVILGILVGDVLLRVVGTGAAQLVLFVAVALVLAVLLSGSQLTVNQAAVSAVLLATIAPPGEATDIGLSRFVDALVGAGVGLVINALLLPVNPLTITRRAADPVFLDLSAVLAAVAAALEAADRRAAVAALTRARLLDRRLAAFGAEVDAAAELARLAPVRWSLRAVVQRYGATVIYLDYVVRHTRVLARRSFVLIDQGEPVVPELPAAIRHLAAAVRLLRSDLDRDTAFTASRAEISAAMDVSAAGMRREGLAVSLQVGLEQVRSTAVDLLRASGLTLAEAQAALDGLPPPPMSTVPD